MAEITGRGTDFRFVTIFLNSGSFQRRKYTFLLHKNSVLINHDEMKFCFTHDGDVLIYKKYGNHDEIKGEIISAIHEDTADAVQELKEAILEDGADEMLRKA